MYLSAVLFDFDGVIADTENVHVAAWQRTLSRLGWELSDETALRAAEMDDRVFLRDLFSQQKIDHGDINGWLGVKQAQTVQLLADAPRIYAGLHDLVKALRARRIRLAVVTTTWRQNVEITLAAAGLREDFELIIAKEDVRNVKPAPDGYLLALERLGLPADQAMALEDSPTGVASARAAGILVMVVGHRHPDGPWTDGLFALNLTDFNIMLKRLGAV